MSFTIDPNHARDDLTALSRGASRFLAPQSGERIKRFSDDLGNAVANAKDTGAVEFRWRTMAGLAIRVGGSSEWKGGTGQYDAMAADVEFDYACRFDHASGFVQLEGVAVMRIGEVDGGKGKLVHFDVERGGWHEHGAGQTGLRAGHPPLHSQFHGFINDLPRLPSLIVHPVDVIDFTILELHQKSWRNHVGTHQAKSAMRRYPDRQRKRLSTILEKWRQVIEPSDHHALIAMQRPFSSPLTL